MAAPFLLCCKCFRGVAQISAVVDPQEAVQCVCPDQNLPSDPEDRELLGSDQFPKGVSPDTGVGGSVFDRHC